MQYHIAVVVFISTVFRPFLDPSPLTQQADLESKIVSRIYVNPGPWSFVLVGRCPVPIKECT